MYAFIVLKKWLDWILENENDLAVFLKTVGTPCILIHSSGPLNSKYNNVHGFYIRILDGWCVTYNRALLIEDKSAVIESAICLTVTEPIDMD
jgi:hypothetical protein